MVVDVQLFEGIVVFIVDVVVVVVIVDVVVVVLCGFVLGGVLGGFFVGAVSSLRRRLVRHLVVVAVSGVRVARDQLNAFVEFVQELLC